MKEGMKEGIQETKEVLLALNELSLMLVKHLKDGFQLGKDSAAIVGELMMNTELKASLSKAAENVSKVPAELKDLDVSEGVELAISQAVFVPKLIEALKKESSSSEES